MVKWVEEEGGAEKVDSEVMMRFLGKTPGWAEKNFQVRSVIFVHGIQFTGYTGVSEALSGHVDSGGEEPHLR